MSNTKEQIPEENAPKTLGSSFKSSEPTSINRAHEHRSHKRHKSFDSSIYSLLDTTSTNVSYDNPTTTKEQQQAKDTEEPIEKESPEKQPQVPSTPKPTDPSQSNKSFKPQKANNILNDLLGIRHDEWPYSEALLTSTIALKTEIQRTKRASMKLEAVQSSIELLKYAVSSGVPPHLIPYIFLQSDPSKDTTKSEQMKEEAVKAMKQNKPSNQTSTSVFKVNLPQQTQFQFHHWQGPEDGRVEASPSTGNAGSVPSAQQSNTPTQPKNTATEEKKRKFSEVAKVASQFESQQQQQFKPSTPTRFTSVSHRRNQSEASVSQLRSIYESQILQQQQQQQQQQHQQQQQQLHLHQQQQYQQRVIHKQSVPQQQYPSLRSPYYNPAEGHMQQRPVYYSYTQSQPSPRVIQGGPPPFQFPRPAAGSQQVTHTIITQQPILVPPQHYQGGDSRHGSENPSPVSAQKSKGKSDVSFLISTPTNPPK